MTPRAA